MECQCVVQLTCTEFSEEHSDFIIKVHMEAGDLFEKPAHIYQITLCYLHASGMLCSVDW